MRRAPRECGANPSLTAMNIPTNWQSRNNHLTRTFTFENFQQAIQFINQVAELAEKANHHPDIEIFDYKKVKISLTTHSVGSKITELDFDLAQKISQQVLG
jgi:4a-hydroxytetrahydrobiopterin dehydratase